MNKTAEAILGAGILALVGWILLPSAGALFLLLFVFVVLGAAWDAIRGK